MHRANKDRVSTLESVDNGTPIRVSEIRDRNNFRDEQHAAPRVDNAPIDP
jgi:hypothetical protein